MARGRSGRIVIEVAPQLKEELYEALQRDGLTLKGWFLHEAEKYLRQRGPQPDLPIPGLPLGGREEES